MKMLIVKSCILTLTCFLSAPLVMLKAQEVFKSDPETYELLKSLSESKLGDGKIILFTTTHQDIAWLDEPEKCKIDRDKIWLTPFMSRLKTEPDFKMDIEQASIVMEYLHRNPQERDIFVKFVQEGRICIGGTFIQPYEDMYSGESLARQFYLGKKWLKDNLNGYEATVYFNNDVPGRTLQMPQLASKAGVNNFVFARHINGLFYWESPDGSKVRCYSPGNHYMEFYNLLGLEYNESVNKLANDAIDWYTIYNNKKDNGGIMPAMLNYEFIWDQKPVQNCIPFINNWNSIKFIELDGEKTTQVNLPKFEYGTAQDFFESTNTTTEPIKSLKGERPNIWVYIHGASHQKALKASREGDVLITQAEKFATANALIDNSFKKYPSAELNQAWEAKIYPDHGWGGKGGDVTDNLFLQKFQFARSEAQKILEKSLLDISGKLKYNYKLGLPIVVFNSLSWERSDLVSFRIHFNPQEAKILQLLNNKGNNVQIQLSDMKFYPDGFLKSALVNFVAEKIPSIGYSTYYLKPSLNRLDTVNPSYLNQNNIFENAFYKVKFGNGGLESLFDKELGKELIDTTHFKAGEIFALNSKGNGAGEFSEVQQPDTSFFDRLGLGKTHWKIDEEGELFTSFCIRQPMLEAVVEMKIILYNTLKKIDFEVDLLNWEGTMYREFRMAFPIKMNNGEVSYEVPFGVVTVGKDELSGTGGEFYNSLVRDTRPRSIQNWISVSNGDFGLTLSSSVVSADWINPVNALCTQTILQPILIASRKSCHWEGNDYHQTGDHHFSFSITSHKGDWKNGYKYGIQANEKLLSVVDPPVYKAPSLPDKLSFFSADKDNLIISTIKKAEDDNSSIIRVYDIEGEDVNTSISVFRPVNSAYLTNLIENPIQPLKINKQRIVLEVGSNSIETLKIE